ncbi:hypothetical protein BDR26DRAFT_901586 [Obelidium mucronatum]|nr:hypothetical protein BDR26DRAFT_901586 [Obelidium mucronatum]
MGCSSSQQETPDALPPNQKQEASSTTNTKSLAWKDTEFSKNDKWTPSILFNLPSDHEMKTKLKVWCKQNADAKAGKLLELVEGYDEIRKRREVFQAGQRVGDSIETGQEVLEANGTAIIQKYLVEGGAKFVGADAAGEWASQEFLGKVDLSNASAFDELGVRFLLAFEARVNQSKNHSIDDLEAEAEADVDAEVEADVRSDSDASSSLGLGLGLGLGRGGSATASETLLAARQAAARLARTHARAPPGAGGGGLEQETPLVHAWRRTRNLIHALGVSRAMATPLRHRVKTQSKTPKQKTKRQQVKQQQVKQVKQSKQALLPPLPHAPRPSLAAGTREAVDQARAAAFAAVVAARVKEAELRKTGGARASVLSAADSTASLDDAIPGIAELVNGPRNTRGLFLAEEEEDGGEGGAERKKHVVDGDDDDDFDAKSDDDDDDANDEKSSHILPITIPHGFQLLRTLLQPKPSVKTVINVSSNNTDSFAVLDSCCAQLIRGTMRVASISVGEERSVPDSHLTGLNKWIYISKFKVTVIATLHLELKVLGLSLELLSQVSSVKPVLCLEFQEERDEIIAGGVGNIRIWSISQTKGTFRLTGPRLIIDDLATEEWITHTATNAYLHRLMVACDCDLLIYDYNTGKMIDRLRGIHELSISAMIFFVPHQYLITASKDSNIKVWTRYNQFILELKSQTSSPVTGMAIANPDDQETKRHPLLLSSYLDGTIRMWNLENGHCVYKLLTLNECLGLNWLRPDVFFHFARDRVCVWNLNRKYISFSTITSAVGILRRIEVPGSKPRLLAVSEDACIKLLSPVTGATLLTAFPVIKDSLIRSVEYDIVSNMLWTLTHSGDVFVYSTVMNPCKVVDEWKAQAGKDLITCMSAFRIAPKGGKRSLTSLKSPAVYTLFGGTDSGQVVTLDIRLIGGEMKILTQAHIATISAIVCCSEKMQLVTAATDGLIKLWSISWTNKMDTTSKDAENPDLCLQLTPFSTVSSNSIVKLPKGYATNISLNLGSETAAFSSETTVLTLFNWTGASGDSAGKGFSEMKKKHAADEDHLKKVTFISSLSSLRLFATSSEDGTAKIWDGEANSLIR